MVDPPLAEVGAILTVYKALVLQKCLWIEAMVPFGDTAGHTQLPNPARNMHSEAPAPSIQLWLYAKDPPKNPFLLGTGAKDVPLVIQPSEQVNKTNVLVKECKQQYKVGRFLINFHCFW